MLAHAAGDDQKVRTHPNLYIHLEKIHHVFKANHTN